MTTQITFKHLSFVIRKDNLFYASAKNINASIDETIAYALAFVMFCFHRKLGFDVQFPSNMVLMSFEITE